jgi:hypothetical protein
VVPLQHTQTTHDHVADGEVMEGEVGEGEGAGTKPANNLGE